MQPSLDAASTLSLHGTASISLGGQLARRDFGPTNVSRRHRATPSPPTPARPLGSGSIIRPVNAGDMRLIRLGKPGMQLANDFAAHADMASTTCQRGVSEVIEGHCLDADARSLEHLVSVVLEPVGGDDELRLPQRQRAVADLGVERILGLVLSVGSDQVGRERP